MIEHLLIVLPGRAYGVQGPALHFPRRALEDRGAETVVVEYPPGLETADDREGWAELHRSVASQVRSFVEETEAVRVTFLAKSLGTMALAALEVPSDMAMRVDAIWITPIFGEEAVRDGAIRHAWRSLLVAGGADSCHVPEHHETVRDALGADSLVLRDADHSLELPGDVFATIDALRPLTEAVSAFDRRDPG